MTSYTGAFSQFSKKKSIPGIKLVTSPDEVNALPIKLSGSTSDRHYLHRQPLGTTSINTNDT